MVALDSITAFLLHIQAITFLFIKNMDSIPLKICIQKIL